MVALAGSAAVTSAAVLNLSIAATSGELVLDDGSARAPLPGGTPVVVGTLSGMIADGADYDTIFGMMTPIETVAVGDGFGGIAGFLNVNGQADDASDPSTGQLYALIGEGVTFAAVTNAAWQLGGFTSPPAPPNTLGLQLAAQANEIVGGSAVWDPAGGMTNPGAVPGALVISPIPEPSAGVLAALALGVFFRRRR